MIEEDEIIGSQSEDSEQHENDRDDPNDDIYKAFGIEKPEEEKETKADVTPAIEKQEPKTLKVKYNKEEIDVPEDQIPDLVEKGMNLDKVRGQKTEYEKALDRAAKLQGFDNHSELIANLDRLEQEKQKQQEDAFDQLRQKVIDDLVYNGVDEETAKEYADNNPLVQQGRIALEERKKDEQDRNQQKSQQEWVSKWDDLYKAYPDLVESAKSFSEGGTPDWFTPEMKSRVDRGYDPKDAYEIAHRDKITAQSKKITEQRIIKEQQLGLRSKVETTTTPDNEPQVPAAHAAAFAAFGLPVEAAKKYVKK